ncbi:MAG: thioredoxin family protein [Polyangiaceae bacterium]
MPRFVAWFVAFFTFAFVTIAGATSARAAETSCADASAGLCADEPGPMVPPSDAGARPPSAAFELVFFWGVGCPHCEEAKPFVDTLEREHPGLRVVRVESRKDGEGRRRFVDTMNSLGASAVGVPTFVVGDAYVTGFVKGETEARVRALVETRRRELEGDRAADAGDTHVRLPLLGEVDPKSVSLPLLTVTVGLADGVNPCAMWVLVVLLGILMHVRETKRMVLYAGTFVVMSGVVYFGFMVAWSTLFELLGFSRVATTVLGVGLLGMGLVNLKDVVWFKKGVSLVIPESQKPGLFRRMRAIAGAGSTPAAMAGIVALAFVVNLVELGCTLGLPAVYTRILSLRGLSRGARLGYIAFYNVAYVVPLVVVVVGFVALRKRVTMTEKAARVLKGVSGTLLVVFGALFLVAPELLAG